ncbi:MAG: helix-turn-helix transcriptional regulator [Thermoanaerobaculum sp.]
MVFADALSKAERLVELQLLFARAPNRTFRTKELAAKLGVAPRTVRAYLSQLSSSGRLPVYWERRGWRLAPDARIEVGPLKFELSEATAVYLAARLLLRHSDEPNPAVRGAVRRLSVVVPENLGTFMETLAGRTQADEHHPFAKNFRTFAYAWALRRVVDCLYHPLGREPFRCRFHPYLLEPALWGPSLYALGFSEQHGAVRVFKVERVAEATLTYEGFTPQDPGKLLDRLAQSWDVWLTDESDEAVCLRFDAEVARIHQETRWHPSQKTRSLPGGSVEVRFVLAPSVPFVNWILSWGDHC